MTDWFRHDIVDEGKLRLFCFFVFLIATFVFIRFSTRMIRAQVRWWPGNITSGDTHVHHVVFGLVFMCVGGIGGLAVRDATSPWAAFTAALFGVGTALALDEFALVLRLRDVYWSEQGRLSVEVVFIAVALCGLALLGFSPFGFASDDPPATLVVNLLINLVFTVICLLKGKVWLGLLGIYLGVFAIIGAIRLARPHSPWARSRYKPGSKKLARATRRERRYAQPVNRARTWFQDVVAGKPDDLTQRPERGRD